jgi:Zn finger protein HypA/HybF involved in hydrogenase expression
LAYGWFLKDIYLGYDESVDVISPIIDILNPDNDEIIHSRPTLKISIKDNIKIDESKIALYIDDQSIRSKDFDFDEDKGVLKFEWDTLQYEDGKYEIIVIAYDLEGNRAEKTIKVEVNNSLFYWLLLTLSGSDKSRPEIWNFWFPIILLILIIALIGFLVIMVKKKRNAIWVKGSRNQRLGKTKMENLDKGHVIKKLEAVSMEEELKRPIILHCKYCKSWFYNDKSEFDIFCPLCGYDQIYASYNCLNCNNWYFKEAPREDYYCPKCATFEKIRKSKYQKLNIFKKKEKEINKKESVRLIRREKIEIEEILANKGKILRYFQPKPKTKYDILNL